VVVLEVVVVVENGMVGELLMKEGSSPTYRILKN
jgi:hypothetical protein